MGHICNILNKYGQLFATHNLTPTLGKAVLQGVVSGGLYYNCKWNRQGEFANVNKYITFIKKNSLVRFMFFVSSLMSKWLNIRKFFTLAQISQKKGSKNYSEHYQLTLEF